MWKWYDWNLTESWKISDLKVWYNNCWVRKDVKFLQIKALSVWEGFLASETKGKSCSKGDVKFEDDCSNEEQWVNIKIKWVFVGKKITERVNKYFVEIIEQEEQIIDGKKWVNWE